MISATASGPGSPVDLVAPGLVATYSRSHVLVLGERDGNVRFARFDVRTAVWNLAAATSLAPESLTVAPGVAQLVSFVGPGGSGLLLVTVGNVTVRVPDMGGTPLAVTADGRRIEPTAVPVRPIPVDLRLVSPSSGSELRVLPAPPSPVAMPFVALPGGGVGTVLVDGSWATICGPTRRTP